MLLLLLIGCTDAVNEQDQVDACESAVRVTGQTGDILCHGSIWTCDMGLDCASGNTCVDPGEVGVGVRLCSDFSVGLEIRSDAEDEWTAIRGPDSDPEAAFFQVNYERADCTSGIGVEFTVGAEPAPGDEIRARYVDADGVERCEWWVLE